VVCAHASMAPIEKQEIRTEFWWGNFMGGDRTEYKLCVRKILKWGLRTIIVMKQLRIGSISWLLFWQR
jgi:hypothetical protein